MARVEEILRDTTTKIRSLAGNLLGLDVYGESHRSHNLLNNTAQTTRLNGLTFTVNTDKSISVSGKASSNIAITIGTVTTSSSKSYFLNGCPKGGVEGKSFTMYVAGASPSINDYGDGKVISNRELNKSNLNLIIFKDYVCNDLVFKPMLVEIKAGGYNLLNTGHNIGESFSNADINARVTENGIEIYNTTTYAYAKLIKGMKLDLEKGTYYLSNNPAYVGGQAVYLQGYINRNGAVVQQIFRNSEFTITDGDTFTFDIQSGGTALTNFNQLIKPMIVKGKHSGKNLLNPTLATTVQNGVTCTNNGDGTYTIKGTNNSSNWNGFTLGSFDCTQYVNKSIRLVGAPDGSSHTTYRMNIDFYSGSSYISGKGGNDIGNGITTTVPSNATSFKIVIYVYGNYAISGEKLFKPMITEDLNATYDDYEPYWTFPTEYEPFIPTYPTEYEPYGIVPIKSLIETKSANLIPLPFFDRWSLVDNEEGEFGGSLDDNFVDHGVNFAELSGGLMSALGTATNGTATARLVSESQKINIGHGKKFVLSGGINIDKYIGLHFYKEGASLPFKSYYSYGKPTLIEDMIDEEYERVQIQVYVADGIYANDIFYPMIVEVQEDGSYPTVFEPQKTSQMDLSKLKDRNNNPCGLYSIGEYKNQISIGRYSGTYIRNVHLLDMGDMNYTYQPSAQIFLCMLPDSIHATDRENAGYFSMSQYYKYSTKDEHILEDKSYTYMNDMMFAFKNTTYTDVDSFKAAMKGIQFLYVPRIPDSVGITNLTEVQKLETYTPYTYVTSTIDITLKYNWYEWQTPKVDWVSSDYFNFEDYIRIGSNIDAVYDFSLSMYPDYEHTTPDYRIDYITIPYADTWNVINDNLYAINQNTVKLDIGTKNIYYDNGKTPNYEEFNKWEYTTAQLMEELRRKARTLPRLSMVLGRKTIGSRY